VGEKPLGLCPTDAGVEKRQRRSLFYEALAASLGHVENGWREEESCCGKGKGKEECD
jgi:hypothetical protein